jgi:hypothetical protein
MPSLEQSACATARCVSAPGFLVDENLSILRDPYLPLISSPSRNPPPEYAFKPGGKLRSTNRTPGTFAVRKGSNGLLDPNSQALFCKIR